MSAATTLSMMMGNALTCAAIIDVIVLSPLRHVHASPVMLYQHLPMARFVVVGSVVLAAVTPRVLSAAVEMKKAAVYELAV